MRDQLSRDNLLSKKSLILLYPIHHTDRSRRRHPPRLFSIPHDPPLTHGQSVLPHQFTHLNLVTRLHYMLYQALQLLINCISSHPKQTSSVLKCLCHMSPTKLLTSSQLVLYLFLIDQIASPSSTTTLCLEVFRSTPL